MIPSLRTPQNGMASPFSRFLDDSAGEMAARRIGEFALRCLIRRRSMKPAPRARRAEPEEDAIVRYRFPTWIENIWDP